MSLFNYKQRAVIGKSYYRILPANKESLSIHFGHFFHSGISVAPWEGRCTIPKGENA